MMMRVSFFFVWFGLFLFVNFSSIAEDWPCWGHDASRNMVSAEKGIPSEFSIGSLSHGEALDLSTTKKLKWVAKLGNGAYGNPTVAGGRVYVGTNNESPRNKDHRGDRGVLLCLDETTGALLWQLLVPKLKEPKDSDLDYLGICSSPAVVDGKVYLVTNRGEVLCLDAKGLQDGNNGPFLEEEAYRTPEGKPVIPSGLTDADILWCYDMRKELHVYPHNITSSSPLILGDRLFVTTSNGKNGTHTSIPSPQAPCLIALDRNTGELLGVESSGISERTFHCNWSSPSFGAVDGKEMVFFGGGDGYCYAFDPKPTPEKKLEELWRFNCVPEECKNFKYSTSEGPAEIIATPVFYENRVYACIGQDPENGNGTGRMVCIDASKRGDISKTGIVWKYDAIRRSLSTPSIANNNLFIADFAGFVHCLDAKTGSVHWVHDTQSNIWGSTLSVDGKVYIGNEDGNITIFKADAKKTVLGTIDMGIAIYSSPVAANSCLYIVSPTHFFAFKE